MTISAASPSPSIVAFGEMLIDFVPDTSGVSLAESTGFLKAPGGAPANVACAITKLGGSSAFIGKVLINIFLFFITNIYLRTMMFSDS
jgi:fructokinase